MITRVEKGTGTVGASPSGRIRKGLQVMGSVTLRVAVALFRGETSEPRTGQAPGVRHLGYVGYVHLGV